MKKILLLTCITLANSYQSRSQTINLNFGLIAQYYFTAESLDDSGPNFLSLINNNGALPAADRFGTSSNAFQFDGFDDYFSASNDPILTLGNGATISLWVKLNDVIANQKLIGKLTTPPITIDGGYLIGVQNGQVSLETWDIGSTAYSLTAGNLNANQWTNIAVTYQFQSYSVLYIDGVAIDSVFVPDGIGANTNDLIIGAAPWDPNFFKTNGIIDDIRIYNRKVNTAEINALYTEVVTGKTFVNANEMTVANNGGLFTINAGSQQRIENIVLTDLSGRVASIEAISQSQLIQLDLTTYPKGVYFANIYTNNGIKTFKLIN